MTKKHGSHKKLSSCGEKKFKKVMAEYGKGTLKSHGKKIRKLKRAEAIAFSEARKHKCKKKG